MSGEGYQQLDRKQKVCKFPRHQGITASWNVAVVVLVFQHHFVLLMLSRCTSDVLSWRALEQYDHYAELHFPAFATGRHFFADADPLCSAGSFRPMPSSQTCAISRASQSSRLERTQGSLAKKCQCLAQIVVWMQIHFYSYWK